METIHWKRKLVGIMKASVILFIIVLSLLSSCIRTAEPEVITVHRNFRGHVIIIFDQKGGMPVKYKGNMIRGSIDPQSVNTILKNLKNR